MMRVSSPAVTPDSPYWKQSQRFVGRDPVEEAGKAFAKKRYSIYSASGRALFYPGLDYGLGRLLATRFGAMPLSGFSQNPTDRDQLAYMRFAEQYAAAYNREMRRLLTENGLLQK